MNTWIVVGLALLVSGPCPLGAGPPQSQDRGGTADSHAFLNAQLTARPTGKSPQDIDQRVRDLLGRMSLKEKIGQMTQLEIGMVTDGRDLDLKINPAKLKKAVSDYGVGSILNVKDQALPIAKWHEIITAIQAAAAETRLKIPVVYGIDTIHGANYIAGATLFPQPLGMAATWNPQLVLRRRAHRRGRDARGRHPLELLAGARHRPSAAVAAVVRDLRRGPVPRDGDGRGDGARLPGHRCIGCRPRRRQPEALRRLQLSVLRTRPHAGLHPRRHAARVLPADLRRGGEGGRAVGNGELGGRQRRARPRERAPAEGRAARRARVRRPRRLRLGRHQGAGPHAPRRARRERGHEDGRPRRHRHEHGAERLQLCRSADAARQRERRADVAHRRGGGARAHVQGAPGAVRRSAARHQGRRAGRIRAVARRRAAGRARVAHPPQERARHAAAQVRRASPGHRPDRRFAARARQRLDDHLAGEQGRGVPGGSSDDSQGARSEAGCRAREATSRGRRSTRKGTSRPPSPRRAIPISWSCALARCRTPRRPATSTISACPTRS